MENKFIVANPMGTILLKCDTMSEVNQAIKEHYERAKPAYNLLGVNCSIKDYQVLDLTEIPSYKDLIKT